MTDENTPRDGAMRDPARISRILADLERYWRTYPDMRLGQIVVDTIRAHDRRAAVFYVEDDAVAAAFAAEVAALPPTPVVDRTTLLPEPAADLATSEKVESMAAWAKSRIAHCQAEEVALAREDYQPRPGAGVAVAQAERIALTAVLEQLGLKP